MTYVSNDKLPRETSSQTQGWRYTCITLSVNGCPIWIICNLVVGSSILSLNMAKQKLRPSVNQNQFLQLRIKYKQSTRLRSLDVSSDRPDCFSWSKIEMNIPDGNTENGFQTYDDNNILVVMNFLIFAVFSLRIMGSKYISKTTKHNRNWVKRFILGRFSK